MAEVATGRPGAGAVEEIFGPRENCVLASLPPAELALLARHLHVVTLHPNAVLQHQDHPLKNVYFPHEGVVSLLAVTPNGETIEAATVGCNGVVCQVLHPETGEAFLTAMAQGAMRASRIAAAQLDDAERKSEVLNRVMHRCREALLLQLRQNIACIGTHSISHRLVRLLLEAADRLETDVPILVTQERVAERLGVPRTTVTLLAGRLQDVDVIRWGRSRVQIRDRVRLEAMACSCYADLRKGLRLFLPVTNTLTSSAPPGSR